MSYRNNEDRFGGPLAPDQEPPPPEMFQQQQQSSGMSYIAPTELVDIPSKGKFYAQGHPLHDKDQIEIRHMTAKDEDILVNQSYLKKGIAIDKLLENIMVDKSIKVGDLLVGDKNALVIAARISGYGSSYAVKVPCPACGSVDEHDFDLDEASVMNDVDSCQGVADLTERGTYLITLPKTSAVVEVKPLTGKDENSIISQNNTRKKHRLEPLGLTDQMKMYVVGVTIDSNEINPREFIDNMPAIDSRYLRSTYKNILPNVELAQHYECIQCGHEQVLEVPFTSEFFWPKQ